MGAASDCLFSFYVLLVIRFPFPKARTVVIRFPFSNNNMVSLLLGDVGR